MKIQQFHHVAFRCNDAKETVDFYRDKLGMDFLVAISEDRVPSTKEPDPYMHVFLDAGGGNILAFFELPNSPPMGRDANTPAWVQHIALRVADEDALIAAKAELEAKGVSVLGPIDHGVFKSIYLFDPNGHRLELAANTATPEKFDELKAVADTMLDEWTESKKTVRHTSWLHKEEFANT